MAPTPAVLNNARLNNFRLGYVPAPLVPLRKTRVLVWINGQLATYRRGSLTIHDALNDQPNTCSLEVFAATQPQAGARVRVTIDVDAQQLLFAGAIQQEGITYLGRPIHDVYPLEAIDDTFRANRRRPFGSWANVSATTVAQQLVAQFCPGFTANHVQASLPAVTVYLDGTEGMNGALTQLARLIGGYFFWEDYDLYLFNDDSVLGEPVDVVGVGTFLHEPMIRRTSNDSQIRTRVYGKGYGSTVPTAVLANDLIVPVEDATYFAPGQAAILGFLGSGTGQGSTTQIISYTNIQGGGATSVGPGIAPSVAPAPALASGTGLGVGTYQYAYTWGTGSGETVPSPVGSVTTLPSVADPTLGCTAQNTPNSGFYDATFGIGEVHYYTYSYTTKTGTADYSESTLLCPAVFGPITTVSNNHAGVPAAAAPIQLTLPCSPNTAVKQIIIWQYSAAGGNVWRAYWTVPNVVTSTTGYQISFAVGTGQPTQPGSNNTPAAQQVVPNGIALGPTGTTQRKVYRTVVNGSQLKLQQTIGNNTATSGVVDVTADVGLGVNAPTVDTSGLSNLAGQVNAGSTSILTSGTATVPASGWVQAPSGEYIRYTSISGNTLQGIPPSGPGAILTTLKYGDLLLASPALANVLGNSRAIEPGAPIAIWVQRDAYEAQAILAAREGSATLASDGIYEHVIVDERRALASLTALCDADLARFAFPIVTVTYDTRDVKTKTGKLVNIYIDDPPIHETLFIHDVTITELDIAPGVAPRFSVTATNVRFSVEDMLRRLGSLLDGSGG